LIIYRFSKVLRNWVAVDDFRWSATTH